MLTEANSSEICVGLILKVVGWLFQLMQKAVQPQYSRALT